MNAPARKFEAKHAVREAVPLLIGLMGPSGSGKTYSALRLASGIQQIMGGLIYGIDTEARRMLHYASEFKFEHVQFDPPFGALDYLNAIEFCVAQGAKVVIVDSMSHEHEGPGGLLDTHEKELDRLAGSDWAKRERVKMLAWQKPKAARRHLINALLQMNANFIFCFRAKQSVRPIKIEGKTEIVPMGFMPIAGDEFLFEQTLNCLLLPNSRGVPTWQSENLGERQMIKLPKHFEKLFTVPAPLDEQLGMQLAAWAKGEGASSAPSLDVSQVAETAPASNQPSVAPEAGVDLESVEVSKWDRKLREAAAKGVAALQEQWANLPKEMKRTLEVAKNTRHKPAAVAADKARRAK